MKLGYLFSGQGKQFANMGQDLYQQEPKYRQAIDEASEALNMDMSATDVFDDPNNTQTAIVAMSTGIDRILTADGLKPIGATGLSLGEYSALVAAGGLEFAEALRLVQDRSHYMAKAGMDHPGKMAAVLKANSTLVHQAIEVGAQQGEIYPANYNTDSQIVIGGSPAGLQAATEYLHEHGIKRVVPLKMSVASHTPFMQTAADQLANRIKDVSISPLKFPVVSNTTAQPFEVANLKQTLVDQLVNPTHFYDCLQQLIKLSATTFVELGPGDTLMKFAKKAVGSEAVFHIDSLDTLNDFRAKMKLVK
ncbi:malonyl CoA-acyl carrier protein transacylase [Lentilactobacillus fungorum]|uniref:Malonyl CoA-acyl carrier protein transacylase n=1 Tax=Lentilactobacillus fungorum TaxID=2201250 RepID=A0ABQ3W2K2_9LACO|nr:ACP S-malonyltransferase [Lentilactobacillus fungorum]GHP14712.1 malonyl CoA-acyl carrier protein transacylase [Lentilactobacillus fungorum]